MTAPLDRDLIVSLIHLMGHDLRGPLTALQSNLDFAHRQWGAPGDHAKEAIVDGLLSCDAQLRGSAATPAWARGVG
jgi:signal transduction histidine kinase